MSRQHGTRPQYEVMEGLLRQSREAFDASDKKKANELLERVAIYAGESWKERAPNDTGELHKYYPQGLARSVG